MHQKVVEDSQRNDVCAKELQVTRAALLRYRGAMAGVVRSVGVNGPLVEDVVHDAFEMACRKTDAERPDPLDEARFGGWLCTLAKYAALTTRNDTIRNREISSPAEELEDVPELNGAYIGYFDDKVAAAVVFANLNADDCSLLHQHFYEDKTVQELALERGIPWTTMRSRLDGVIHRARTIMDDKSCRRRALGASTLAWAMFFCRQVYAQVLESWSKSKRMVSATAFGFVAGGAVVAVLVASSSNCGVSTSAAYASTYASASGATRSDVIAAASVMPVSRHVEVGVSPAFESCVVAPFLAMPITTNVTKPPSTSNSVRVNNVEDRSRGLIPWGVNASMRDVSKQK